MVVKYDIDVLRSQKASKAFPKLYNATVTRVDSSQKCTFWRALGSILNTRFRIQICRGLNIVGDVRAGSSVGNTDGFVTVGNCLEFGLTQKFSRSLNIVDDICAGLSVGFYVWIWSLRVSSCFGNGSFSARYWCLAATATINKT